MSGSVVCSIVRRAVVAGTQEYACQTNLVLAMGGVK